MGYTFTNTEKTKKKGSEYETFAALYMLGLYPQKEKMEYILVDSFNDVSTANPNITEIYDIQSKGYKSVSQGQIGRFLYTLYKNYLTNFPFKEFILFLETIDYDFLSNNLKVFSFSNFKENNQERIKTGLYKEIKDREQIALEDLDIQEIKSFLDKVVFVVNQTTKEETIKKLLPINAKKTFTDAFYISIFDEIRDKQSSLKNINIENETITTPEEVLRFNKHITKKELDALLINRVIGVELFQNNIPLSFFKYINENSRTNEMEDAVLKCNEELALMLFDKNNKNNVWKLCFRIVELLNNNSIKNYEDIFNRIPEKMYLNAKISKDSTIYLISRIQEGKKNANS
ncbi:MAG: hypothetical protein IIW80_03690 [Treponema sp.]|nr:hypothetical protein [Treponema sp.]